MLLRFARVMVSGWKRQERQLFCWIQLDVAAKPLAAECMVIWFAAFAVFSQAA
jgi:hypothetical protein